MKSEQKAFSGDFSLEDNSQFEFSFDPQLILIFGQPDLLVNSGIVQAFKENYPHSIVTGCSTAGEICSSTVIDDTIVANAISFDKAKMEYCSVNLSDVENVHEAGIQLLSNFSTDGMRHIFVLSDGLAVNGTDLVEGIREKLPEHVNVTGGLAGDGSNFNKTYVIDNGEVKSGIISALAFYGDSIEIGYGSLGGWTSFGIERSVTSSKNNVLYELDNLPALEIYKSYLGDQASQLPSSGLLFPLSLRTSPDKEPVVRTILAVDEKTQSLTFAGDIPEGAYVKLMKANVDDLIIGAEGAADVSYNKGSGKKPEFAILISCVGRKLVMKQLVEEEVEAVKEVLGEQALITGFYSYGELAPFQQGERCELHNQTMTITTFTEF
ncbi:MAG: FIST C-terminal domain-containing protein [Bacteroidales bacterium]|nr:FIST C-terminal domain-containing protein [Bacteroidales bacterium]MCF8454401.1 FIST C-terminal domain-containing protein [Bacteroidales bacterium]